jgi:hypothetical protein
MKDLIKSLILAIGRLFPERLSPGHAIVLSCDEKGQIRHWIAHNRVFL